MSTAARCNGTTQPLDHYMYSPFGGYQLLANAGGWGPGV